MIRYATPADLPQIVEIYNAAIPDRRATADTEPITVRSRIDWLKQHDPDRHPLWVVADGTRIDGWLSLQPFYGRPAYRATAEIGVYVSPPRRRCGAGRALLGEAVSSSPRLGLTTLLGFVFAHNDASLALFASFGFERWGLLPRVAEFDGSGSDLVIVGLHPGR